MALKHKPMDFKKAEVLMERMKPWRSNDWFLSP
jgi:hypothetical protein